MSYNMNRKTDKRCHGELREKDEHPESIQIPTPDHIENRIARYQIEAENDRSLFKDGLGENDRTEFDNNRPGGVDPRREREARAIIDRAINKTNNNEPKIKRKNPLSIQISTYITTQAKKFLVDQLNSEDISVSNFLKEMIYKELTQRGYDGPTSPPQ